METIEKALDAVPNPVFTYLPLALLGIALLFGAAWVVRVYREAKGEAEETPDTPEDMLSPLSEAYAAGQMSEEEFKRIRDSLLQAQAKGEPPPMPVRPKPILAPTPSQPPTEEPPGPPAGG